MSRLSFLTLICGVNTNVVDVKKDETKVHIVSINVYLHRAQCNVWFPIPFLYLYPIANRYMMEKETVKCYHAAFCTAVA